VVGIYYVYLLSTHVWSKQLGIYLIKLGILGSVEWRFMKRDTLKHGVHWRFDWRKGFIVGGGL
jgi:hypothetical protein